MLVFLYILIGLISINLILYFSYIKLEIEELKIDTSKNNKIENFKIKVYLVFLNKIKYFKIAIDKEKVEKLKNIKIKNIKRRILNSKRFQKIKKNGLRKNSFNIINTIKKMNINFEQLDLKTVIGIENIIILSYLIAILDIIISIVLTKKLNKEKYYKIDEYKYIITPKQTNKFYLNLSINCIISIKIANIINIILKKRGKENERTSYRIFNGNSHEQYTRYGRCKYNYWRTNLYK